jgi:hypothetical protein
MGSSASPLRIAPDGHIEAQTPQPVQITSSMAAAFFS